LIGISASLAACLGCFSNACANVHCVNPCVCFEANKYSSSSRSINSATTGNSVTSQVECPSRVDDCKYTLECSRSAVRRFETEEMEAAVFSAGQFAQFND